MRLRSCNTQQYRGLAFVIRILIADDHQIVRAGLSQFITDQPDMRIEAEAACGDEVIHLVHSRVFDVIVLDIAMPNKNGIDCLHIIRRTRPQLPVLILSGYPESNYAVNTLRAGASGYISKMAPPEEVLRAIRVVARGKKYISDTTADLVSGQLIRASEQALHETLSEREFQVFSKIAAGMSPTRIAEELNVSVKTITTYRTRVLQKMALKTNADLTYYAVTHGLMD
jgi:two-component system, NarL family, invasion response regulator UvrY